MQHFSFIRTLFKANMFYPRRCLNKKRPQKIGFYNRHKRCASSLCKYKWCLLYLDLQYNEWESLMTKDNAVLQNFQLLIPRGKQQVHLSSASEILMPSYKSAWREVVLISPVAAGTRASDGIFGECNRGALRGSAAPCQRKQWGMFRRKKPVARRSGREVACEYLALNRLIFQAKPFLLSFLFSAAAEDYLLSLREWLIIVLRMCKSSWVAGKGCFFVLSECNITVG